MASPSPVIAPATAAVCDSPSPAIAPATAALCEQSALSAVTNAPKLPPFQTALALTVIARAQEASANLTAAVVPARNDVVIAALTHTSNQGGNSILNDYVEKNVHRLRVLEDPLFPRRNKKQRANFYQAIVDEVEAMDCRFLKRRVDGLCYHADRQEKSATVMRRFQRRKPRSWSAKKGGEDDNNARPDEEDGAKARLEVDSLLVKKDGEDDNNASPEQEDGALSFVEDVNEDVHAAVAAADKARVAVDGMVIRFAEERKRRLAEWAEIDRIDQHALAEAKAFLAAEQSKVDAARVRA